MLSSNGLIKNARLSLIHTSIFQMGAPTLDEIKDAYPPTSEVNATSKVYTTYKCGDVEIRYQHATEYTKYSRCSLNSWYIGKKDDKFYHQWRGESLLVSDSLLPIDTIKEISRVKDEELKKSAKARLLKVDTPMDAVRVILVELGYKPSAANKTLRVYVVGACHVLFTMKEPYDVIVGFGFYTGGGGSPSNVEIDKLNLADPQFHNKVARIMSNAKNFIDIIAGRAKLCDLEITA
jgi:hypothetical protein